ncbi:sulfotransferase [Paenibacillus sp. NPDC058174]|uniref:sulfotransferase n=1 Tax=Paenibacillus sp. NPDC058174 TaxID=3346366 RepID=UPI0036DF3CB9
MLARSKAIVILGMHRSGTSLLAKTIKALGVYIGRDEQMISPREDNPEGFWEHSDIVDIHEKLLGSLSSSWDTTKPLPAEWWLSEELQSYRSRMKDIIASNFSNYAVWGFKDPRTCLLLPLWKSVFQELNVEPVYIICLRNPLNVAASLYKRDRFTNEKSMALWNLYVMSSLYYTIDERRLVVSYDRLIEQPVAMGERISHFLNIPFNETERDLMGSLPNGGLRHGNYSSSQLWQSQSVPSVIKQIYQLCLSVENENNSNSTDVNASVTRTYENLEQTITLMNHERGCRFQFYWSGADEQFSEEKSSYITVDTSGKMESYQITIKEVIGSVLRVSLPQELTMINCSKLMLTDGQDEINLHQSSTIEYADFLELGIPNSKTDSLTGLTNGEDPQWVIKNLPPLRESVTLHIDISCSFQLNGELVKKLQQQRTSEEIMNARHDEVIRITENKLQLEISEKETLRLEREQLELRLQLQIKELQLLNVEQEATIRLAATQIEKQLETLELLYEERVEAKQTSLNQELQAKIDELQTRLQAKNKLPSNDHVLLLRQKDQEVEQYRREIDIYKSSMSWRITMPMRWMGDKARNSKRRGKMLAKHMLKWYAIQHNKFTRSTGLAGKLSYKKYALIISHTNYLESMGGTEKYIYEQTSHLAYNDVGVIQIYPAQSYSFLATKEGTYYGVVADGQFKGFHTIIDIVSWLTKLHIQLRLLYTHHLLNWQIIDYMTLYQQTKNHFSFVHTLFIHDFFVLCTSYHMMYEPKTEFSVKQAGDRRSCISEIAAASECGQEAAICQSCRYGLHLSDWRQAIQPVLDHADQIVVPSFFVKDTVSAVYSDIADKITVKGHLVFTGQSIVYKPKPSERKIRIAYLGYRMDNKGWQFWERLYKDQSLRQIYEFHHVGSQESYADHVIMHQYSFLKDGKMAATNLLINHEIDLVLLWSIVPESYSYTLHEAIAAGVPVLTSPKSGNIAATIDLHPELGKVLHSEEQLLTFLANPEEVKCYVSGEKARYVLESNHLSLTKEELQP